MIVLEDLTERHRRLLVQIVDLFVLIFVVVVFFRERFELTEDGFVQQSRIEAQESLDQRLRVIAALVRLEIL